jgi:2-keto-4-pentenoate hydratase/2-oxohepta-3-ene-1,7-dioic acid hydratase in catechol pathway
MAMAGTKRAGAARHLPKPTGLTFATLATDRGYRLGVRTGRGVLDVELAARRFRVRAPVTIDEVIAGADCTPIRRLIDKALTGSGGKSVLTPEARVRFGPAVPNPGKIICVGLNYRRHAQETGNPIPPAPILFNKYNNALVGHRGTIRLPTKVSSQFDYEVELVLVIGRKARDVPEERALAYVFGYANGNDFSARDLMRVSSQLMLGKTCDGFAPLGPWVVSADQIPDPQNLAIATYVNGEQRQNSNTSDMIFNCAQLVSYCSRHFTLMPGDIIYTGTPQGVILGYPRERQVWLKAGDRVLTEVEKCGTLEVRLV